MDEVGVGDAEGGYEVESLVEDAGLLAWWCRFGWLSGDGSGIAWCLGSRCVGCWAWRETPRAVVHDVLAKGWGESTAEANDGSEGEESFAEQCWVEVLSHDFVFL